MYLRPTLPGVPDNDLQDPDEIKSEIEGQSQVLRQQEQPDTLLASVSPVSDGICTHCSCCSQRISTLESKVKEQQDMINVLKDSLYKGVEIEDEAISQCNNFRLRQATESNRMLESIKIAVNAFRDKMTEESYDLRAKESKRDNWIHAVYKMQYAESDKKN
jgi:hypothetical protein